MPLYRFAIRGLMALALLVAVLVALRATDRHRDLSAGIKVDQMEALGDELTFVLVGSSRTMFHLIPGVVDSTMAAHGVPVHSFNYGLLGTPATEISYSADRVLRADLPALRAMAVELQPLPLRRLRWHPLTRKGAYHFDAERTLLALDATRVSDLSAAEKRAAASRFLRLGLRHYLAAGQGTNLIRSWLGDGRPADRAPDARGFVPLGGEGPMTTEQVDLVYERYYELTDWFAQNEEVVPTAVDSVLAAHFDALERRAADRGIEVVFVVQPMTLGVEGLADLLEQRGAPVVRLNDPSEYAEFYDSSLWHDGSHLNAAGARRVSETAARAMAEAIARAD